MELSAEIPDVSLYLFDHRRKDAIPFANNLDTFDAFA